MPYKDKTKQREAWREWYHRNPDSSLQNTRKQKQKMKDAIRSAKERPCADCGIQYPYWVMQLDHLEDKSFSLGQPNRRGYQQVLIEIAKCEAVCANCHADRTYRRSGVG